MKNKHIFLICLLFLCCTAMAQPYTVPQYQIRKDSAVLVGTVLNYCNFNYDIKVNIYKPIGDNNYDRPVAIFVHGGGFVSGENFNEPNMDGFAREFAKRGYVGVSIDYREGMHLYPYGIGNPYANSILTPNPWEGATYAFDSAEVIRANFRAQQDLKAVIRFMKKRNMQDSTSTCRYFLGGHSAGAITVLTATFMDQEDEKPSLTLSLSNTTNPNWTSNGFWLFGNWIITQINGPQDRDDAAYRRHNPVPLNYDLASCYARPDLGFVKGSLHDDEGYDTRVLGIAPLAGGLIDTSHINSQIYKPAVFLYHIPNDLVVPFNTSKPFNYLCDFQQPCPNNKWPKVHGSNIINTKLNQIAYPAAKTFWVYDNGGNPLNSHDILPFPVTVADSVAKFFGRVLDTCTTCPPKTILATTTSFNAKIVNNTILLQWKNESTSVKYFIVERSFDGIRFEQIATIDYSTGVSNYSYTDMQYKKEGNNFYRIKEVYQSGKIDYTSTVRVNMALSILAEIFPNPAKQVLNINLQGTVDNIKALLYDSKGRLVISKNLVKGSNKIVTQQLSSGIYNLVLNDDKKGTNTIYKVLITK